MLLAYLAQLDKHALESLINHGEESSARESTLPDVGRAQLIRFVIGDHYRGTSHCLPAAGRGGAISVY